MDIRIALFEKDTQRRNQLSEALDNALSGHRHPDGKMAVDAYDDFTILYTRLIQANEQYHAVVVNQHDLTEEERKALLEIHTACGHLKFILSGNICGIQNRRICKEEIRDLHYALELALDHDHRKDFIRLRTKDNHVTLPREDIFYIEKTGRYATIHAKDQDIKIRKSMKNLEEAYTLYGFVRTHVGYIVNLAHVKEIKQNDVVLTQGALVPVSKNRIKYLFG